MIDSEKKLIATTVGATVAALVQMKLEGIDKVELPELLDIVMENMEGEDESD